MPLLDSKVTLITGAKGGLGTSVTQAFLDAGATVVGVSRSIEAGDFSHPAFTPMPASLSTAAVAQQVVAAVIERFSRIDSLVHVMGGFAGGSRLDETTDAVFESMLDVNYRAAFFVIRAVLPHMRKQESGHILAVASRQGVEPSAMVGAYSASKAALVSLVHTVALENKDRGISGNTVLPGTMDTPTNRAAMPNADRSQWVEPARVAALLVYLASDAAAQITGAAIPIYGPQV